jgi:hypothetical protein
MKVLALVRPEQQELQLADEEETYGDPRAGRLFPP